MAPDEAQCRAQLSAEPLAVDAARPSVPQPELSSGHTGTAVGIITIGGTDSAGIARGAAGLIPSRIGTAVETQCEVEFSSLVH